MNTKSLIIRPDRPELNLFRNILRNLTPESKDSFISGMIDISKKYPKINEKIFEDTISTYFWKCRARKKLIGKK